MLHKPFHVMCLVSSEYHHIKNNLKELRFLMDEQNIKDPQIRWELIKYEVRKVSMAFSKQRARYRKSKYNDIESKIKNIEELDGWEKREEVLQKHDTLVKELERMSNYITEGIIIRSRTKWYELGEKSNKYFLSLEKRNKSKTHVKKLVDDNSMEIINPKTILRKIHQHFSKLFESKSEKTLQHCLDILGKLNVPKLSDEARQLCDGILTADECLKALQQMGNSKTPGNDAHNTPHMLIFTEGGKPEDPEKNPRGKGENNTSNKLKLTYGPCPGIEPGPQR
ncbi:Transposon TX1 uncharacterized 149 kDa protein [Exaiptasia diaphana]|nr:Transposon TX1 uncharacterized 149 kDa protein [Exaiptasia diaphana]